MFRIGRVLSWTQVNTCLQKPLEGHKGHIGDDGLRQGPKLCPVGPWISLGMACAPAGQPLSPRLSPSPHLPLLGFACG